MKTKTITRWVDLWPGWQDGSLTPWLREKTDPLTPGSRRFRIDIELPCFGGSAEEHQIVTAKVSEEGVRMKTKPAKTN